MASYTERPAFDLEAGRAVLDEDLPKALARAGVGSLDELGWCRPNRNTLLVPLQGMFADKVDDYLLKLHFRSTRDWPPSAQFVNPETLEYRFPADVHHLPMLAAGYAQMHPNYGFQVPGQPGRSCQLICCSATYEYYDTLHGGDANLIWKPTDTFEVTLGAITRALGSPFYQGRYPHG
ncbi:MAG: hypothetical protein QOJ15_1054 [Bradyrhizobium sp.]|nr:hypothetical protein [Bradyrhizobium sp.]